MSEVNVLALPALLAAQGVALCPERPGDDDGFLYDLYAQVRWPELVGTGWDDAAKHGFLSSQFAMQTHHYRTHYQDAQFWIIRRDDRPIGRLYVHMGAELRIVDISLLDGARNGGIGGTILRALQYVAGQMGVILSIHVESFNPAQNLYRRLGFTPIEQRGPYWLMHWLPSRISSGECDDRSSPPFAD